ncbi:MAG: CPBP family intramembrane metalloprotease [Lachnospiraceae bacterium]|nr:CPBP family intramembrane metalloprotease [Lachnospiraceae bacterium]
MGKVIKQLGKAICYIILFGGMQFIAYFVAAAAIGAKVAFDMAATGGTPAAEEIAQRLTNTLWENMNWIQILAYFLILFGAWFVFAIRKKKLLKEANVIPFSKNRILPIILLAVSAVFLVELFFSFIPEEIMLEYEASVASLLYGNTVAVFLSTVIGAPIIEELIFRGLVFSRLNKAMPLVVAAILSSIAFGLFHGQIVWIGYATCLGLVMCFVSVNCQSVLASILFHMVFNFLGSTPFLGYLLGENMVLTIIIEIAAVVIFIAMIFWMVRLRRLEETA